MNGAFALMLLMGGAVVLQGTNFNNSSPSAANHNLAEAPVPSKPMTLNTVAYAERVVQANVSLPDAAVLGPGFRIVGVEIDRRPMNQSTGNGVMYRFWSLNLYLTNQPFFNGSTLSTDLFPQAVIVKETPAGPNSSSYEEAKSFTDPGQACVVSTGARATTSCTQIQGPATHLIQIRNTFLAITPSVPNAFFMVSGAGPVVAIYPGAPNGTSDGSSSILSYQQLLALAGSIIP
jgi:hypothetical protein